MYVSLSFKGGQRRIKATTPASNKAVKEPGTALNEGEPELNAVGVEDSAPVRDGSVDDDVLRAVEVPVAPAAGMVVEAKPIPLGPMLIVCPFTTMVVGVAEGPIL